jgi:hypothetical protein
MNPRFRLALVVGGLVLMAVLVRQVGLATIASMIARVGWAFVAMVALYAIHSVFRALVLWICLGVHAVPFVDVLRIRFSGEAVEALTYTGPLLAEPAKGMLLTSRGVPTVNAFAAISLEYLLYTVSSAGVGAAAALLLLQHSPLPPGLHGAAVTLFVVMLGFIGATIAAAVSGVGLIAPTLRALRAAIGGARIESALNGISAVEAVLVDFLHTRPSKVLISVSLECVSHALLMTDVWVVLHALRLPATVRTLLVIEGSAKLVAFVFFFVPAQLGASEGSNALIFPILGLPVAAGVTLALLRRVRSVCIAGIGIAAGATLR